MRDAFAFGIEGGEHAIEAAAGDREHQEVRRDRAGVAIRVPPVARGKQKSAGTETQRIGRAFDFEPQFAADDLRSGALRRILPRCEPQPSTIYAVYPSNRLMSAKVRAFVDHLARRVGRTPYWDKGLLTR
ncbi:MAG: hypothetical protein K2Y27_12630 [Xanthobacteraceae bacterium]|nr:hypothetical protein [Xanthobacteraceae bacterium]